jgi:Lipoprotein LpqB beta-propeller domain
MTSAAQALAASRDSSWRVSRDGVQVAVVALRHEGGDVVVAADLAAAPAARPHRFDTLQAAEAFVGDLIASFAYLGCDVATP